MFESIKSIEKSNIERHIFQRREYFGVCEQLFSNEFVRYCSRAYGRAARQIETGKATSQGDIKKYFEEILEVKHIAPVSSVDVAGIVVALDCKEVFDNGRGLLPHDLIDYLSEVERLGLVREIQQKHTQPKLSQEEIIRRREEEQQRRQRAEEASQRATALRKSQPTDMATGQPTQKKNVDAGYATQLDEHLKKVAAKIAAKVAAGNQ